MKPFIAFLLFFSTLYTFEIEHFLLPKDGDKAEESLINDISHAKKSINVAMFMVTNKKLTNALKERVKKGKIGCNEKSVRLNHSFLL